MSQRIEARERLLGEITGNKMVRLTMSDRRQALNRLLRARSNYEDARREVILYEQALFFRVVVFGSARLPKGSEEYQNVSALARILVQTRPFDTVSGGGPGIMEAVHQGANIAVLEAKDVGKKVKIRTHGVTIDLPKRENPNAHNHFITKHQEFTTRLQEFLDLTQAAYVGPGGFGTALELLFLIQNKQVNHLEPEYPIIADPIWEPVIRKMNEKLYHQRVATDKIPFINEEDLKLVTFTNNMETVAGIFVQTYDKWRTNIRDHVTTKPAHKISLLNSSFR